MATAFFSPDSSTNVRTRPAWLPVLGRVSPAAAAVVAARLFRTPPRRPPDPAEAVLLATGRALAVGRAPRRLAAWTWGAGPRVLLAHGWGGRGAQLGALVRPLVDAGFSVVAFDGPAHGASGGRLSSLPQLATALAQVAARTGPLHGVVAHSLGAAAASLAMSRGLAVARAVFVGAPADPGGYLHRFLAQLGVPEVEPRIRARFERRFGLPWAAMHVPTLARRMTAPLLVVHDRGDREVPWEDGAALAAAWPGAELVTTAGLGHRRVLADPAVVARAVDFLAAGHPALGVDRCATPGCPRPGVEAWGDGLLCCPCALERELFDPGARWRRAVSRGVTVATR